MTEIVPCLLRVGDNVKKYRIFKLDRDQVTIGRSGEVTYAILSNMISRCHAVIDRQDDGSWNITDKKSMNGIYVNGRQLVPFQAYTMQEGDMIQLGVATSPDTPAEFIYKFHSSLKVRIEKKSNKRLKTEFSSQKDTLSASESIENESETELRRKKPKEQEEAGDSLSKVLREQMEQAQKEQALKEAEYQARLAEMEKLLKEKEDRQMEVQQQLERERQEKECQAREVEELKQKEQAILQEMQDKQEELEKEREQLKQKMQEELEASLKDREQALKSQLSAQREALMNEKKQVEENLQKEMEKALEEKNKELEKELQDQKKKLEQVIEKKELEQKVLESQLNETKEESATAKLQALKARDDVLSNFVDLMEMELQCTICNELFIKATSLNCAHVFCKLCISQWMKVKKECPNCRTPIKSQVQALALDSYIDRMVEQLNDELKDRRKELLEQRKAEQLKFDGVKAGPSASVPSAVAGSSSGVVIPRAGPRGVSSTTTSTTTTTSSNSNTTQVRTSNRISARRARTRGGRANPATTRPPVLTTASLTRAAPSVSVTLASRYPVFMNVGGRNPAIVNVTAGNPVPLIAVSRVAPGSIASPIVANLLSVVRSVTATSTAATRPTVPAATSSAAAARPTVPAARTIASAARPTAPAATIDLMAAQSTSSVVGASGAPATVTIDLTGVPSATVPVAGASSATAATPSTSVPAVAAGAGVPANSSVVDVSSDREQGEDEEEDEEEEDSEHTDSDDPIHYRRRRYYSSDEFGEEEENEDNDDDDTSVEGDPSVYYGGYGRCYNCGRRGHWANGCPN